MTATASSAGDTPRSRMPAWKRALWIAIVVVAAVVLILEVTSRVADRVVLARTSAPDFDAKAYRPGWIDKLTRTTLDPESQRFADARTGPHPHLAYALKPGWSSRPGAAQQASHNALGFRGKETTYEKPPGVFRIVTIGGSSVYGSSESSDEAVWSARLERMLADGHRGRTFEVIDGGCPGYNSFEMLINLELRLLDFAPDLVIVYESINDSRVILYTAGGPTPKNDDSHYRAVWPVLRRSPLERWLGHSRAYLVWRRYCTDYLDEVADQGAWTMVNYRPERHDLYCQGGDPEPGFAHYRRNLENIVTLSKARGAEVLIATQALIRRHLPPETECRDTLLATFDRVQSIQREVAKERGARFFESGKIVEAEDERRFLADGHQMFKNDVHPFDDGSELIARTIAEHLLASDLLR